MRRWFRLAVVASTIVAQAATGVVMAPRALAADKLGQVTEYTIPTAASNPTKLITGPNGNIWFAEAAANKIGEVTTSGAFTEHPLPYTINVEPLDIAVGSDGNLWFTEAMGDRIGRMTTGGALTEFPLPTANSLLDQITAGPDGNLWFTEQNTNKIGKITTAGAITEYLVPTAGGLSADGGVGPGPDGNVWFTEGSGNKIGIITPAGVITEFPIATALGTGGAKGGVGGVFSGDRAAVQLVPSSTNGPPAAGGHAVGDLVVDARGVHWLCVAGGTPGTFLAVQTGGLGKSHFNAVSTSQYTLNSDGTTWKDLDATKLSLTIKPLFNCQAILSTNSDLWTTIANYNQDIGIAISGGAYPSVAGQPEAWKESGGPGTYSPNAAFLETTKPLAAGTTYNIKLVWKSNVAMPASGPGGGPSLIAAGAGPIPAGSATFSPTRLAAQLIVDM
jgi:hypothetical protein